MSDQSETSPEVLSTSQPYTGKIVSVRLDEIRFEDGHVVRQEIIDHRQSMSVIAIDGEGKIILVRQYRHPAREWLLETPAGSIDEGEVVEAAVNRELAEETGYRARSLMYLGSFYLAPGWATEFMHAYLARDLYASTAQPDDDEDIEVIRLSIQEWEKRIRAGKIKDCKSIASWYLARPHLGV